MFGLKPLTITKLLNTSFEFINKVTLNQKTHIPSLVEKHFREHLHPSVRGLTDSDCNQNSTHYIVTFYSPHINVINGRDSYCLNSNLEFFLVQSCCHTDTYIKYAAGSNTHQKEELLIIVVIPQCSRFLCVPCRFIPGCLCWGETGMLFLVLLPWLQVKRIFSVSLPCIIHLSSASSNHFLMTVRLDAIP